MLVEAVCCDPRKQDRLSQKTADYETKTGLCAKRVFPWQADQSPSARHYTRREHPAAGRSLLVYVAQAVHCSPRDAGDED